MLSRAEPSSAHRPTAVTRSTLVLATMAALALAGALLLAGVAIAGVEGEVGSGIALAAALVFAAPPAVVCGVSAWGLRRRARWGYWAATIAHLVVALGLLLAVLEPIESLWLASDHALPAFEPASVGFALWTAGIVLLTLHAWCVAGLLGREARRWFGVRSPRVPALELR